MRFSPSRLDGSWNWQYALHGLLGATFLLFLLGASEAYRALGYCLVIVLFYSWFKSPHKLLISELSTEMVFVAIFPVFLVVMHMVAVGSVEFVKPMRHLIVAVAFTYAMYISLKTPRLELNSYLNYILGGIFLYAALQLVWVYGLHHKFGTTKNPHYLAQGCMLLLLLLGYCWGSMKTSQKWLAGGLSLCLFWLLINTLSRPAWIGFVVGLAVLAFFLSLRQKLILAGSFMLVSGFLLYTNLGHFADRVMDLCRNVSTEERVLIWHNMGQMLNANTPSEWLIGHGMTHFREHFKSYSEYHLRGIDFNSPHNFILELLYLHGGIGLLAALGVLTLIYIGLVRLYRRRISPRLVLLMLVMLSANIAFTSITLPFYTAYNLNIIAIVVGVMFALNDRAERLQSHHD